MKRRRSSRRSSNGRSTWPSTASMAMETTATRARNRAYSTRPCPRLRFMVLPPRRLNRREVASDEEQHQHDQQHGDDAVRERGDSEGAGQRLAERAHPSHATVHDGSILSLVVGYSVSPMRRSSPYVGPGAVERVRLGGGSSPPGCARVRRG